MTPQFVICNVTSLERANAIVDRLREAGFWRSDISVLHLTSPFSASDVDPERGELHDPSLDPKSLSALGWLTGVRVLSIPRLGELFAVGLFADGLQDHPHDPFILRLQNAGLSMLESCRLERRLRDGHFVIAVMVEGGVQTFAARSIVSRFDAAEIVTTRSTAASSLAEASKDMECFSSGIAFSS